MKFADLHVHTHYSDSTFSPKEVVSRADAEGLAAIAICDHDCIDGIEPCLRAAAESRIDIEIVPAIELTTEMDDVEIHLLGYFIEWRDENLQSTLNNLQERRVDRLYKMIKKLKDRGIDVEPDDVLKLSGKGSIGRLHLARAMLKTKMVKTQEEAFNKYIGFLKPCYVRNIHFTPREAIELISSVKGVPVLAHPSTMRRDDLVTDLVESGLKGIEVYHSDHSSSAVRHYNELARKNGLIATGGSDCHGLGKDRVLLGSVRVPYEVVEKLKRAAGR